MLHPPQFLRAIMANPKDDAPRLAYADWLGHDQPLGEFIHLQCLLAQSACREPSLLRERREQDLLAQFHTQWSNHVARYVEWCSFRRGFIEEVSLGEKQLISHAGELFRLAPVMDVHLRTTGEHLDDLPELPFLKHTFFLDLSAQPLGDEGAERLADTPMLAQVHGLNLGSCRLSDVGLDALIDSPDLGALRELYLNDNAVSDDSLRRFVLTSLVEQLDVLDVRNTQISAEGIDALKRILGDKCLV